MKMKLCPSFIPINMVMKRTQKGTGNSAKPYSRGKGDNCQCGGCNR